MKKRHILILILVFCLLVTGLAACSEKTVFMFSQETYIIFLDGKTTIAPSIISTNNTNYTLHSSNDNIIKVENKKITALKEGIVTLTATYKDNVTTAQVMVFEEKDSPFEPFESDGKYVVYFAISNDVPDQESDFQRIAPGELAKEPTPYDNGRLNGFILEGWYEDRTLERKFDFKTPIYKSITLYPKFMPDIPYFNAESYKDESDNIKYILKGLKYTNVPYEKVKLPTIYEIKDEDGNVTASYPFEQIGEKAFFENPRTLEFIIPENYKFVGESAFEGAKSLKTITFEGGLDTVEDKAFANNGALETFSVNGKIENMGLSILANCPNLSNATILDANEIRGNTFYNAKSLKEFTFGDSIEKIGSNAFAYSGLKEIYINNVSSLGEKAFYGCTSLDSIDGKVEDFEYIGRDVFGSVGGLLTEDHTSWLLKEINRISTNSFVRYKNALILAAKPSGLKQDYRVKHNDGITYIASGCFKNTEYATVYFELNNPPKLGEKAFGDNLNIDVLISSKENVKKYINEWLEVETDEENDKKSYTDYSWQLAKSIYYRATDINSVVEYGYRDEIKKTDNRIADPIWNFVDNGYRAVMINQIMKDPLGDTIDTIDVIADLNKFHSQYIIDKPGQTPIKTTLEKIKSYGLNDEPVYNEKIGYYESRITKIILPNSGFVFRNETSEGLKVETLPTIIEKNAIKLPSENAKIYFKPYDALAYFKVPFLISSAGSNPSIYPTNDLKIYVTNVELYKSDPTWKYIKDQVFSI